MVTDNCGFPGLLKAPGALLFGVHHQLPTMPLLKGDLAEITLGLFSMASLCLRPPEIGCLEDRDQHQELQALGKRCDLRNVPYRDRQDETWAHPLPIGAWSGFSPKTSSVSGAFTKERSYGPEPVSSPILMDIRTKEEMRQ